MTGSFQITIKDYTEGKDLSYEQKYIMVKVFKHTTRVVKTHAMGLKETAFMIDLTMDDIANIL